jgi:hypothetical protein
MQQLRFAEYGIPDEILTAVISIFRQFVFSFKPPLIIFIAVLIPMYLMEMELIASILLGYLTALALGAEERAQAG